MCWVAWMSDHSFINVPRVWKIPPLFLFKVPPETLIVLQTLEYKLWLLDHYFDP